MSRSLLTVLGEGKYEEEGCFLSKVRFVQGLASDISHSFKTACIAFVRIWEGVQWQWAWMDMRINERQLPLFLFHVQRWPEWSGM